MSVIVRLLLGVVIGYLGSLIMRSDADRGTLPSTAAGITGALLAGWLGVPLTGTAPSRGFFTSSTVAVALLGAVVLVGLVNLLGRGRIR
jgi:uncharacterized membrane protein YeaQ/YmgE (transglycosylase-associated protein family)